MTSKLKPALRGSALLGAAVILAGSMSFAASPAFAEPGSGQGGTITVHKLEKPASGDYGVADGSELTLPGTVNGLAAGFKVCEIAGIDLKTQAGWDNYSKLKATMTATDEPVVAGYELINCTTQKMTATGTGIANWTLPGDKAYVVFESKRATGAVAVAEPAIVSIPYASSKPGEPWNYNPHIYPKNVLGGIGSTKDAVLVGDKLAFDVKVPIKSLGAGITYNQFKIEDQLSSKILFKDAIVKIGGTPLSLVTDYTLTSASNKVVMELTSAGLVKLNAAVPAGNQELVLTINASLLESGDATNKAQIFVNGEKAPTEPEVPNPETKPFFDGVHILKTGKNKNGTTTPLAGATFEIYAVPAGTADCKAKGTDVASSAKVAGTFTTVGAAGKSNEVTVAGGTYCAYETKAPAGYKPITTGQVFQVSEANRNTTVLNTQVGVDAGDLPALPVTGAAGNVLMLGGGVLLLGAAGALFAARRRNMAQNS